MNTILFVGQHSRTYDVRWHSHDHWELVYCTGGQGEFRFENGPGLPYRAGEAAALPPGERHANFSRDGFTNIYLTMAEPAFPFRGPFLVEDDAGGHLQIAFAQARDYFLSDLNKRELVMAALGDLIASYMVVYRSNQELFSEPVERIRQDILLHYAQAGYALEETLRELPFHYDYLRKRFKKEMGVTPLEYMTGLRMKKAETLLTAMGAAGYSVGEVAQQCGYDDALYFSRVFKKHFGLSPAAFAKGGRAGGKTQLAAPAPQRPVENGDDGVAEHG